MDFYAEVQKLKDRGVASSQLILVNDALLKAAVAWPMVQKSTITDLDDMDDVWDFVSFDPIEWMKLSQLAPQLYTSIFLRCKRLNIIYPDGEIAKEVIALANQQVRKLIT